MTKQEILQLFQSSIDMVDLEGNFPECDMVVTELEDGQQEIIVRLQGVDPDFHPSEDILAIEALGAKDILTPIKNVIVLNKLKRKRLRERMSRRDKALFKRIKAMVLSTGLSLSEAVKVIQQNLPSKEIEE